MKALLTSESNEHYTPVPLVEMCRDVLGGNIGLDLASTSVVNRRVGAEKFYSEEHPCPHGVWSSKTVICNPPGGKIKNKSQTSIFYTDMLNALQTKRMQDGVFIGFSMPALLAKHGDSILTLPYCIVAPIGEKEHPEWITGSGRIKFDRYDVESEQFVSQTSPKHSSIIILMSYGRRETVRFNEVFATVGWLNPIHR